MKQKTRLLAMLLAGMIVLAGCSRPAADTPAENDDPAPEQQEQQEELWLRLQQQSLRLRQECWRVWLDSLRTNSSCC